MAAKVELVLTKTLPAKILDLKLSLNKNNFQKGFTLLEIMIVIGILGGLTVIALSTFRKKDSNIKKVARDFSVLAREVRNTARLKNMTHRIVFDTKPQKHAYWIESASGAVLIKSKDTLEKERSLSEEDRPANPFQKTEKFFKDKRELPPGFFFGLIESKDQPEAIHEDGKAYMYFSPEGLVEPMLVQITDKAKLTWTLIFNPLTGRTDIIEKALTLKDLQ